MLYFLATNQKKMKTKITFLVLFFLLLSGFLFSQDTSSMKYFPMNTGNIWVYKWYHHMYPGIDVYGKMRTKIIGTIAVNSKTYFIFNYLSSNPNYYYCGSGLFDTLRVDSISCNVYRLWRNYGCSYSPGEVAIDSLKAKMGDTVSLECGSSGLICDDTAEVNFSGTVRKSKNFLFDVFELLIQRRYIKGIGLDSAVDIYVTNICNYYLQGCVIDGIVYGDTTMPVGISPISTEIPVNFNLFQNYPNPFNPSTKIKFDVPNPLNLPFDKGGTAKPGVFVRIAVYDILGRELVNIVNERLEPGTYEVEWNASLFPSGVYICFMSAGEYSKTIKMVLLK